MLRSIGRGLIVLVLSLGIPAVASAQASIAGTVKDSSGAVLPGVTVEASSPALIEKARSVVTDGTGQYKIVDLRPGTYTVTFTLTGFNTVKREGIVLEGFFSAPVSVEMKVGAVEETITVTGETPIVDIQSTRREHVINSETLSDIPTAREFHNLAVLIPGMVSSGTQDVGVGGASVADLTIHGGFVGDGRLKVGNLSVAAAARQGASASHYVIDMNSSQETAITTSGGLGEAETAGVVINVIPREGGNTFKGLFFITGATSKLQSDNLTTEVQNAGLKAANRVNYNYDVSGSLGGPIVKNRLWFYVSGRANGISDYVAGMYANLNANNPASWTYAADLNNQAASGSLFVSRAARLTWQATRRNKINFFWDEQYRCTSCSGSGSATAAPETASYGREPIDRVPQIYWQAPVTSRLLLEGGAGSFLNPWGGRPRPGANPEMIAVTEQCTNGCVNEVGVQIQNLAYRGGGWSNNYDGTLDARGSASYVTGAHNMKFGFHNYFADAKRGTVAYSSLSYRLNNGSPNQLTESAQPFQSNAHLNTFAVYAQDQWTFRRLSLQGGVRYDHGTSFFPSQQLGPSFFVPNPIVVPDTQGALFQDLTPRMGAVYDLFGTGKTAVKVTLGKYPLAIDGGSVLGTGANTVNRLTTSVTRSWNDGNKNFVVDCNLLNPLANSAGGDTCGQISNLNFNTATPSTRYDPAILEGWGVRPFNWDFGASIEQQLTPRIAVNGGYSRRWYGNFLATDNLKQAATDYTLFDLTVPSDPRLANSGGLVTGIPNINSQALLSSVDNYITAASNYGKQIQVYNGVDLNLSVRAQNGLLFQGGYSIGRTVTDDCEILAKLPETSGASGNPGAASGYGGPLQYCHQGIFQSQVKFLTSYTVPRLDVQVGATLQSLPGPALQANYTVTTAIAAASSTLGRSLVATGGSITVPLLAPNAYFGDRINQLDLRFSKILRLGGQTRTRLSVDLFNALNSSVVQTVNPAFTPGGLWNVPTLIMPPRIVKIGGQIDF